MGTGRDRTARALRLLARARPLATRLGRLQAAVLRAARGRIRRSRLVAGGQPVLSLTTTGRRSGRRRSTTVAYMRAGEALVVTGLNLGSERPPLWTANLEAEPRAEVHLGGARVPVRARRARGEEARGLWARWVERLPISESFRRISGREPPIFVLEPEAGAPLPPGA